MRLTELCIKDQRKYPASAGYFLLAVRSRLKKYLPAHYFYIAHDPDSSIVLAYAPCDMLPSPAEVRKQNILLKVRLQVTKYNLALRADSTKYLLSRLAAHHSRT